MEKRIVINGANGFLGRNLVNKFLREGYQVVALARGRREVSAQQRVETALREVADGSETLTQFSHNLRVIDADVNRPDPDLLAQEIRQNFQAMISGDETVESIKVDEFILNAALTSMREPDREALHKVNVEGTQNMLQVVEALGLQDIKRLVQIGTGFDETGLNPYTESKREAAKIFSAWCEAHHQAGVKVKPTVIQGKGTEFGLAKFMEFAQRNQPAIRKLLVAGELAVAGDPDAILDMVRVEETAENIYTALQILDPEEATTREIILAQGKQATRYRDYLRDALIIAGVISEPEAEAMMTKVRFVPKDEIERASLRENRGSLDPSMRMAVLYWKTLGPYQPMVYFNEEFKTAETEALFASAQKDFRRSPVDLEYLREIYAPGEELGRGIEQKG